jgi:pantoate--beta-alanine ligase
MIVLETVQELRDALDGLPASAYRGFVPTMGCLHAGHQALIEASVGQCEMTVVSIFVNPAQFAPGDDFKTYPRTMERDLSVCKLSGVDFVFTPGVSEVYPIDYDSYVETGVGSAPRNSCSEGAARPTFFRGVATVLTKLFVLIRPNAVFFGQKDAQQCAVVRRIVRDLWFNIEVVICDTTREKDGLAMSSRNAYLSHLERQHASVLYEGLLQGAKLANEGVRDVARLRAVIKAHVENWERRAKPEGVDFRLVYISICCSSSMRELDGLVSMDVDCIACTAAMMGKARLIDNVRLKFG